MYNVEKNEDDSFLIISFNNENDGERSILVAWLITLFKLYIGRNYGFIH